MEIKWGEDYRGPGQADPSKTREQRAQQLQSLAQTQAGWDIIAYYFAKYTGALHGVMPPVGLPMIQTILGHEYPNG